MVGSPKGGPSIGAGPLLYTWGFSSKGTGKYLVGSLEGVLTLLTCVWVGCLYLRKVSFVFEILRSQIQRFGVLGRSHDAFDASRIVFVRLINLFPHRVDINLEKCFHFMFPFFLKRRIFVRNTIPRHPYASQTPRRLHPIGRSGSG